MYREVAAQLRGLLINRSLAPGQVIDETRLARDLGVDVPALLQLLEIMMAEGMVGPAGENGYLVRNFTERQMIDAIELRGVLEGAAARIVAERGASKALKNYFKHCLDEAEKITADTNVGRLNARWSEHNLRFHNSIVEASENDALIDCHHYNARLPYGGAQFVATILVDDPAVIQRRKAVFDDAKAQHRRIVGAILAGDGASAEARMREHTDISKQCLVMLRLNQ